MKDQPGNKMDKKPENGKTKLPGSQPRPEKKDKKKEEDAGPISEQDYSSPKNQSGKNTPPESED